MNNKGDFGLPFLLPKLYENLKFAFLKRKKVIHYDVVIVGAGGAGLYAARELSRQKKKVLIIEKNENLLKFSFHTLGSFMDVKAFDLTPAVIAQPIKTMLLKSTRMERKLMVNANVLDKVKVHEELLAGLDPEFVTIKNGLSIVDFECDTVGRIKHIIDKNNEMHVGKYFIDATGFNGVLSRKLNLQPEVNEIASGVEYNVKYKGDPQTCYLLIGKKYKGGYGWIFPMQNGRAIFGFGSAEKDVIKILKKRLDEIILLPEFQKLVEKDNNKCEGGTLPITAVREKLIHHNLICIGDSVTQVNPTVGEGYKFIFESAKMGADAIVNALNTNDPAALAVYEEKWKQRFLHNYHFSKRFQRLVMRYSHFDWLMDILMIFLKRKSDEKVIKVIAGEYNRVKQPQL